MIKPTIVFVNILIGNVNFNINIFEGTGNFEISEGGSVAVTGRISILDDIDLDKLAAELPKIDVNEESLPLKPGDIYKDLGLRGYDYKGVFKGVKEADSKGNMRITYRYNVNKSVFKNSLN